MGCEWFTPISVLKLCILLHFYIDIFNVFALVSEESEKIGCFFAGGDQDDLPYLIQPQISNLDILKCVSACNAQMYRYAGLRVTQCYCGSFYGRYGASDKCVIACTGNSSQLCGSEDSNLVYHTGVLVPGPVSYLKKLNQSETSLTVEWNDPSAPNGKITEYVVKLDLVYSYSHTPPIDHLQWKFSGQSHKVELPNLHPGAQYNITVIARNEAGLGIPKSTIMWTAVGYPDTPLTPDTLEIKANNLKIRIFPSSSDNGPISSYQIIVVDDSSVVKFDDNFLYGWSEAEVKAIPYYIAAEFSPQDLPDNFIVGDGGTYGGYFNPPLKESGMYHVILGVNSVLDGEVKRAFSLPTSQEKSKVFIPKDEGNSTLTLGLSIAVAIFALLLMAVIFLFFLLKSRVKTSRGRALDHQELTLQTPVPDDDGGLSSGAYYLEDDDINEGHYLDRLREQVWNVPQQCYTPSGGEDSQFVGFGQYGEVQLGKVMLKDQLVKSYAQVVNDQIMRRENKQAMLKDLGVLIKSGSHSNVINLIGIAETPEKLHILLEYYPSSLKQVLLEGRALDHYPVFAEKHQRVCTYSGQQLYGVITGIIRGMIHLANMKIVHKRLCCANIAVLDGFIPKVTGFSVAQWTQSGKTPDYTRWTAQESLRTQQYIGKSDVWSFGVLLWEVATLGGTPYTDVQTKEVSSRVMRGLRLPQTPYIDDELYQLMLQCWQIDMDERPSFAEIQAIFYNLACDEMEHLNYNFNPGFTYAKYDPDLEHTITS